MRITYFNIRTGENIPSETPVELEFAETRTILNNLHGSGSFLGLEIAQDTVLQFYSEEGAFWMEVLDTATQAIKGCMVSLPMAEIALEAAFQRKDIQTALVALGYDWLEWKDQD